MIVKELSKYLDQDVATLVGELKLTMIGTRAIFVQNFVKLLSYTNERLVFKIKKDIITVLGENFKIVEMGKHEIVVTGNIFQIASDKGVKWKNIVTIFACRG